MEFPVRSRVETADTQFVCWAKAGEAGNAKRIRMARTGRIFVRVRVFTMARTRFSALRLYGRWLGILNATPRREPIISSNIVITTTALHEAAIRNKLHLISLARWRDGPRLHRTEYIDLFA